MGISGVNGKRQLLNRVINWNYYVYGEKIPEDFGKVNCYGPLDQRSPFGCLPCIASAHPEMKISNDGH